MGNNFQQPNNVSNLGKPPGDTSQTNGQEAPRQGFDDSKPTTGYDWATVQRTLSSRFTTLTDEDFASANGDRAAFVERLAQRQGISANEAGDDLSAFEGRQNVTWRTGAIVRSNPGTQ